MKGFSSDSKMLICIPAILEQSMNNKMVSKILVGMCTPDIYLDTCQIHEYLKPPDVKWRYGEDNKFKGLCRKCKKRKISLF